MRDLRKFRNKLTLELDNRQIAFFLAGLLAVLAVVFALGVVVGKGLSQIAPEEPAQVAEAEVPDVPEPVAVYPDSGTETDAPDVVVEDEQVLSLNDATPPPGPVAPPEPEPESDYIPAPAAATSSPEPTPPSGGGWTVQLSAHENPAEADARQKQWIGKGVQAYIVKAEIPGKGTWYRVRVGQFANKAGAQQYADALAAKEGIKPYVAPIN